MFSQTSITSNKAASSEKYHPKSKNRLNSALKPTTFLTKRPISGGGVNTRTVEYSMGVSHKPYKGTNTDVEVFKSSRIQEKSDMKELNSRLAHYIEKSRYNEAENKKLMQEFEKMKEKIGKENNSIKNMYDIEMKQLRTLLDSAEQDKMREIVKNQSERENIDDLQAMIKELEMVENQLRQQMEDQDNSLSKYEAEVSLLRKQNNSLSIEKQRNKNCLDKLRTDLAHAKSELSNETLLRIDIQNNCQSINEELEFCKDIHSKEIKELNEVIKINPIGQCREWWSNEFSNCIAEIQSEYDNRISLIRDEMESFYNFRIQDVQYGKSMDVIESSHIKEQLSSIKSANVDLKNRIGLNDQQNAMLKVKNNDLVREMNELKSDYDKMLIEKNMETNEMRRMIEQTLSELQTITDDNMSLQMEILAYRKLIEYEENRNDKNTSVGRIDTKTKESVPSKRSTYQKSSKGSIVISSCDVDGSYIAIENSNPLRDEKFDGWKVVQSVNDQEVNSYSFNNYTLKAGCKMRIVCEGTTQQSECDVVWHHRSQLSVGDRVVTCLLNENGQEKAIYTLKTLQSIENP